ncbi:MAG TPA: DUF885 domain-containing protein [Xanthomonadales bacterium]|nr:DUF885 domain-containing protein [Xanthomonadales bacterium]
MKRLLKWLVVLFVLVVMLAGAFFVHVWYFKPYRIDWFYSRVFARYVLDDPELLSRLRLLEGMGLHFHNDELTDASQARADRQMAQLKADYETLRRYDTSGFEGQDRLSYDILEYFLGQQVAGERWRYHNFPLNQMYGVQADLPNFMADVHQVANARDARNYIARLEQFPRKFAQVLEGLKLRESKGIIPPQFVVEKVLAQMQGFVALGTQGNPLRTTFAEKLSKVAPAEIAPGQRNELLAEVDRTLEASVFPAYRELIAYFESLRPKATRNDGAWSLPDGEAFYAHAVSSHTTTSMTPDEIHAIGLAEVARIGAEMDAILRGAGFVEGTLGARVQQVGKDRAQLYSDDDAGRAQILKDYQAIIDEISAGLDAYFATKPKAPVEVRRVPAFAEKTAPGAYYQGAALDGSRPGIFFANLRNVAEIPRFGMKTLAYHEAVPGHHFQIATAQELKDLPIFRRMVPFTAYSEGWALYAERVAKEAGFHQDPLTDLGRLQAEMFRAVRLVVDTGLHAKRWTREQAIDYMLEHTGMGQDEVTAEIERYIVNPGQALAYKVGMNHILALREKARAALGERFDIRRFHDEVLKNGAMPLAILERVIDDWIARERAAAA